ncbi:MAG TPA: hypothetical protein VFH04_04555 [Nitrososphaeraceae archaeon]|jgi:branched-subunit amino acid aminotransferase/4-amino-4-deoxychorismate lyase|nr:hypothetical protein [Nitrososphaeraceae archaeon]
MQNRVSMLKPAELTIAITSFMWNTMGESIEGTISNIFWFHEKRQEVKLVYYLLVTIRIQ